MKKANKHHSEVAFVEHHLHPSKSVIIIERYVPAENDEHAPVMFGNSQDGFTAMKLEGRYLNGKRI